METVFNGKSWSEIIDTQHKNRMSTELTLYGVDHNETAIDIKASRSSSSEIFTEVFANSGISNEMFAKYVLIGANNSSVDSVVEVIQKSEVRTEIEVKFSGSSETDMEIEVIYLGDSDILTEITKRLVHRNKIKATLDFFGYGEKNIPTEITVKQYGKSSIDLSIHARAIGEKQLDTIIDIVYANLSEVLTEIQPVGFNDIPLEIEVRPHNRVWSIYEVQQPPIITDVLNPTKDSFTRESSEYSSINYGSSSSMVVGSSPSELWRSFVQFDTSYLDPSYKLTGATLRLFYKGVAPTSLNLEIFNADNNWYEYSITNLNRPAPIKLITNEFTVNTKDSCIEFNVFNIVNDWGKQFIENNGFIIRVANETDFGQVTFYTRESILPPELVISYFDSRIFSQGRTQIVTEITSKFAEKRDYKTEIEVSSTFEFTILDTYIRVHRLDEPMWEDYETEILVSKPCVETYLQCAIRDFSEIETIIYARSEIKENRIDSEVAVSRPVVNSEIFVAYNNIIETELIVPTQDSNEILSEVSVSRSVQLSCIYIKHKDTINTEIHIAISKESAIPTELSVCRPILDTELFVKYFSSTELEIEINPIEASYLFTEISVGRETVLTEIQSKASGRQNLYSELTVSKPLLETMITVSYRSDILTEIERNSEPVRNIDSEITVSVPYIETLLEAKALNSSTTEAELHVKHRAYIETEIDAKKVSQLDTEIDIIKVSKIQTEIISNKPYIETSIVIPTWVDYDLNTIIEPRIFMVNNVYTTIQVGSSGGAYAFII